MLVVWIMIGGLLFSSAGAWAGYVNNRDGSVTDDVRGLVWQRADDGRKRTWEGALAYCRDLDLAKHKDWRLPNKRELAGLVDLSRGDPSIDPAFKCQSSYYWSSTPNEEFPDGAWYVGFYDGGAYWFSRSRTWYVRCVRGGRSSARLSISGKVAWKGAGLAGVTVKLTGGAEKSTTTNNQGIYRFSGLATGTYILRADKEGFSFTPQELLAVTGGANNTRKDFKATQEEVRALQVGE